jgi:large subunit ribosomal protein L27
MAHVKGVGTTKLGRDSESKRLGVKISDGGFVRAGGIIIRQRGQQYRQGNYIGRGKDDTLFSLIDGKVSFSRKHVTLFTGKRKEAVFVNVTPATEKK